MSMQTAQTQRPNKVWRVSTNDTAAPAQLLHEEPDEAFSLSLSQTHNQQHLLLYGESMTTKYLMTLSAAHPEGELSLQDPLNYSACKAPMENLIAGQCGVREDLSPLTPAGTLAKP